MLLLAAVYSDVNQLAVEPLIELSAMILIIMTAVIWRK